MTQLTIVKPEASQPVSPVPPAVQLGQLAQQLLRHALAQRLAVADVDTKLIAVLRNLLTAQVAASKDRADLCRRLNRQGYDLRMTGGVLSLCAIGSDDSLCPASLLGVTCVDFVQRYGAGRPLCQFGLDGS